MKQSRFPLGWDEARVRKVLEHYEAQSDEEVVAEDEAAFEKPTHTAMDVPVELVPVVRELIAKRKKGAQQAAAADERRARAARRR